MKTVFKTGMLGITAALALNLASPVQAQNITGAGASFPAPLYAKWTADYAQNTSTKVNYQSVGSSAGMKQIESKTVDFGATDEPLKDEELKSKGLVQFPTVVGGIVPIVNVQGLAPGKLVLDGPTLANIYLGKITKWNDAAIKALNPGLGLPDAAIAPVRRADGSGTTFNFTNYLSKVSPEWKEKIGEGKAVNWPVGTGGKGNEGVAQFVTRLPNSIGYVEYAYVKQNKMNYARMKNASGNVVSPDENTFKAATAAADWKKSFYQILTNQSGKNAWPITAATYIVMHARQDKPQNGSSILKFFSWAYANGDKSARDLDYVPIPAEVKTVIARSWSGVKDASGKALAYK